MIGFEWNLAKEVLNKKKHGVSFREAKTVFDDFLASVFDDELHSYDEKRFYIVGYSFKGRFLTVSFTERNENIRIISARLATKNERKNYEEKY